MELTCKKCGLIAEPELRQNGPHTSAYCTCCGGFLKHVPKSDPDDFVFYIGKYKGRNVKSMTTDRDERSYLVWAYENMTTLKPKQIEILKGVLSL